MVGEGEIFGAFISVSVSYPEIVIFSLDGRVEVEVEVKVVRAECSFALSAWRSVRIDTCVDGV